MVKVVVMNEGRDSERYRRARDMRNRGRTLKRRGDQDEIPLLAASWVTHTHVAVMPRFQMQASQRESVTALEKLEKNSAKNRWLNARMLP